MTKLTKPQRARLDKLATYLEGLPEDYAHFGMGRWVMARGEDNEEEYARKNGGFKDCGTVACAAGHGPMAGILVPPRFIDHWVDWHAYCELFVGSNRRLVAWCFDGEWEYFDDHHYGAAARIRYLLDHGEPPEDFWSADEADSAILTLYAPYRIDTKVSA